MESQKKKKILNTVVPNCEQNYNTKMVNNFCNVLCGHFNDKNFILSTFVCSELKLRLVWFNVIKSI